jgi:hypothetical protein
MSVSIIGKANTTRLRDGFETDGDIDDVAKYIAGILDDVADIDADPEFNALIRRCRCVAFGHATLNIDRAAPRIHNAVELSQEAIAGVLYNGPAMRRANKPCRCSLSLRCVPSSSAPVNRL